MAGHQDVRDVLLETPHAAAAATATTAAPIEASAAFGLRAGRWLEGVVHHAASYGLWVDVPSEGQVGGEKSIVRGLVHSTEMDSDCAKARPGDIVQVRVVDADPSSEQLRLSMRLTDAASSTGMESAPAIAQVADAAQAGSSDAFAGVFASEWLPGVVAAAAADRVAVDVVPPGNGPPVRGVVPAARVEGGGASLKLLAVGQAVHVRVLHRGGAVNGVRPLELSMLGDAESLKADLEEQLRALQEFEKSSLSARPAPVASSETGADATPLAEAPVSQWFEAVVSKVWDYGAEVEIPHVGAQGLVYVTEMEQDVQGDPKAALQPGQAVLVRVLGVDGPGGSLLLSMRASAKDLDADVQAALELQEARASIDASGGEVEEDVEDEPEEDLSAYDMEINEKPKPPSWRRLSAFLDMHPDERVPGVVRGLPEFGAVIAVDHPHGGPPVLGVMESGVGAAPALRVGQAVRAKVLTVDSHRGLITLSV